MTKNQETICIVGAGQAGCELALALRQQGCAAPIELFGEESHPPYQRPPLSKAYLKGEVEKNSLHLRQQDVYTRANIELVLGASVERIDPHAQRLTLSNGEERTYDRLALTTGGRPRKLAVKDAERAERANNFGYLRTIDHVLNMRPRFKAGQRLVIVGGGYIGLEVAAAAIACGLNVTVLEAFERVLARVTAPEISNFYEHVHREAGVALRTAVEVTGFEFNSQDGAVSGVCCSDGSVVPADLVLVGVGLVPNTELAQAAGLTVDNGIVVDEYARTSDSRIVAAGDCTNHPSPWAGCRVRLESVSNAVEQARSAAASLAGAQRRHDAVPWFWSDQYDLKLRMVGLSRGYDRLVLRGSLHSRSFAAFYLRDGRVIACDTVNRLQEFVAAKRFVTCRAAIDPTQLADEAVPVKDLASRLSQESPQ